MYYSSVDYLKKPIVNREKESPKNLIAPKLLTAVQSPPRTPHDATEPIIDTLPIMYVNASTGHSNGEEREGAHGGSNTLFWRPIYARFCSGIVPVIPTNGIGSCD